jgi:hypothetical protein
MSPNSGDMGRILEGPFDLYNRGDQLAPVKVFTSSFRDYRFSHHGSHVDRTYLFSDSLVIRKSGWEKPSILLGALLFLREEGILNLHGERRLSHLLVHIRIQEVTASVSHRDKISKNPSSFRILLRWVQRPFSLKSFHKKEKRRIGTGYHDKGSTATKHRPKWDKDNTIYIAPSGIFLGENKEFLKDIPIHIFQMFGFNGYPPFHHLGDGWWRPWTIQERARYLSKIVREAVVLG